MADIKSAWARAAKRGSVDLMAGATKVSKIEMEAEASKTLQAGAGAEASKTLQAQADAEASRTSRAKGRGRGGGGGGARTSRAPKAKAKAEAPTSQMETEAETSSQKGIDRHSEESKANKKLYSSLNYKLKTMAEDGNPQPLMDFRNGNDKVKQSWVSKFKVDPKMAWLEGCSTTEVGAITSNKGDQRLLTPEQLGGPQWLNSPQHVQWLIEADALPTQPHEIPALAAKGVVQVVWNTKWKTVEDYFKDSTSIKARGEMTKEDYEKVQMAMSAHNESPGVAGKTSKKNMSPEEKKKRDEKTDKQKTLTLAQSSIKKVKDKIAATTIDPLLAKLSTRSWGKAPVEGIQQSIQEINTIIGEVHTLWCDHTLYLKTDDTKFDAEIVKAATKRLNDVYDMLDEKFLADARALK